jgi:putative ABC transport system permease protein
MKTLFQDLQYAFRLFQKSPGFILIAVLTLGLGIGANTAVFSVVNAFLLRPLPYQDPDRLVMIQRTPVAAKSRSVYSYPVFNEVREQAQSLDGVTAFAYHQLTLDSADGPETVLGSTVASNFFAVVGVAPLLGRAFLPGEDEPNKPRLVILSHGLWQRRFGADPKIIGQTVRADKETIEVIGIMPPKFKADLVPNLPKVEFWATLNPNPRLLVARNTSWLNLIARLKPAATLTQAQTELGLIAERIRQSGGQATPQTGNNASALSAITVKDFFVGDAQKPLLVLLGAVGFVLLIAFVNVANLLLAHGVGRQKELAIRAVLGANRRRLVSQMLNESLLLSLAGGLLGLLLVTWLLKVIVWLTPKWMVRMEEISLDRRVFLFTLAASLLTGLLFGLLPSLAASKIDLQSALKSGTATAGGTLRGFRYLLVIAEVALAVVLLVGAGLMINSFVRLTSVNVGFNEENVLSLRLNTLARPNSPEQVAFMQELLLRVQSLPGVRAAALIDALPMAGGSSQSEKRSVLLEGPLAGNPDAEIRLEYHWATPGYFQTLGLRLLKGRLFTDADTAGTQPVVVVSEQLAEQAWPGEDPIGKRLLLGKAENQHPTVIGVVTDVRRYGQEPSPNFYSPFGQQYSAINHGATTHLVIRAATDPLNLTAAVRNQILAVDRRVVVDQVMTLEERLSNTVAQPRFYAVLLGWFGAMGLLLSVIGLYGVISYSVSQMTREVGIRLALGAQRRDILTLIVGHGLVLTLIGLALGLAGAIALGRLLTSLLFGVTAIDPATYISVSLLLLLTALVACYLPARRATKVDPLVALRYE